ncbi:MAG: hypothetical protein J6S85_20185 [Methanobrevibacter sp.]|nr:hypothetical protein [Methanobrevibacter sp.]
MLNEIEYKSFYDNDGNTTAIKIINDGFCVLTLEFYGQLQPAAVKAYADEAVELLIEKGVLKKESKETLKRRLS